MLILYISLIVLWAGLLIVALHGYKKRMLFVKSQNASNASHYKYSYIFSASFLLACYILLCAWLVLSPGNVPGNNMPESDCIFILDISNSMNACDLDNNLSRIEAAKKTIIDIINCINNNCRIGLVAFAGQAQVAVPLTTDKIYYLQILHAMQTNYTNQQTTNIQPAIETGIELLTNQSATNNAQEIQKRKKIIILTDGENHYNNLPEYSNTFKKKEIELFVIGFGTKQGGAIPVSNEGTLEYLKDISGREVITKLDVKVLQYLSKNYLLYPVPFDKIEEIATN